MGGTGGDALELITHVVHLLMGNCAVVLQDVVVDSTGGVDQLLQGGLRRGVASMSIDPASNVPLGSAHQNLGQLVVRDVGELRPVVLGDHKLRQRAASVVAGRQRDAGGRAKRLTAWPLLRGPMSRKANVLSLSKSFMQGISPVVARAGCSAPACQHCGQRAVMVGASPWALLSSMRLTVTLDDAAEDASGHGVGRCSGGGRVVCGRETSMVQVWFDPVVSMKSTGRLSMRELVRRACMLSRGNAFQLTVSGGTGISTGCHRRRS